MPAFCIDNDIQYEQCGKLIVTTDDAEHERMLALYERGLEPVPDPELPFLGVHLTRMIEGSVTVGPNAVQGWKREGYGRVNFSLRDTWDMLTFGGFWKVTLANLRPGIAEYRNSLFKRAVASGHRSDPDWQPHLRQGTCTIRPLPVFLVMMF